MHLITGKQLDRRTVLKGIGATIALPLLDAMMPVGVSAAPKKMRLVAMEMVHGSAGSTAFGATKNLWAPAATGSAFDLSPTAIAEARRLHPEIEFFVHDAVHVALPSGFDVVTCSLFLHHLGPEEGVALLANMEHAARHLVLVNDLARSRWNFMGVWLACRLLTRSRVVRFDGPASVRSALTPEEARTLAERAGLSGARVQRRFPARFLLAWERR